MFCETCKMNDRLVEGDFFCEECNEAKCEECMLNCEACGFDLCDSCNEDLDVCPQCKEPLK